MCWVGDALLLVGDGPQGVGLYRCRDTKGKDEIDEATLLFSYAKVKVPGYGEHGGMGEHGPHAVLHGPDGSLYVVNGNHTWAKVDKLAANSPLRRWPNGQMGPDQDQPDSTEDVLLPRLNDANGHAANILAPGGCIWRLDADGRNPALVAGRLPQRVRRRLQPQRRAVHLRQRHGVGRGPAVVSAGARQPLSARRRLRLAHRLGQHAGLLHRQPAGHLRRRAAARRSAWSSTNTPPSRRSTRAPT